MDGRSLPPLLVSDGDNRVGVGDATASSLSRLSLPGSVQRYLDTQLSASKVRASWRTSHFIEYYYVGIGGDCGMAPIELPDNNFIAIRVINTTNQVDLLYVSADPLSIPLSAPVTALLVMASSSWLHLPL